MSSARRRFWYGVRLGSGIWFLFVGLYTLIITITTNPIPRADRLEIVLQVFPSAVLAVLLVYRYRHLRQPALSKARETASRASVVVDMSAYTVSVAITFWLLYRYADTLHMHLTPKSNLVGLAIVAAGITGGMVLLVTAFGLTEVMSGGLSNAIASVSRGDSA